MNVSVMYILFGVVKNAFTYSGELREDNDIKQEFIAKMLNVRQATYSRYETGDIPLPIESYDILADFYKTSIDYLTGRTNEKTPYK